jgi:fatty acid desaturase
MTTAEASASARERSMYSELLRMVRDAGLFRHRRGYYVGLVSVIGVLLVACILALIMLKDTWWQLLTAATLGITFTQIGFIVHDAGHRQIGKSRGSNHTLGLVCADLIVGFSFEWWVSKHIRHHVHPNHEGLDPDIESRVIAFYPAAALGRHGFRRAICHYQAAIMSLALPFQSVAMRTGCFRFLRGRRGWRRKIEFSWLIVYIILYSAGIFVVLSPWKAIAFIAINQGVMGTYFALAFAPNHKGMPVTSGEITTDFLTRQVTVSRNIRPGPVVDFMLAGLGYQIEHHLFPSMPRPSLRRAAPIVREFCRRNNIPYTETTLMSSYRQAFTYLNNVCQSKASNS